MPPDEIELRQAHLRAFYEAHTRQFVRGAFKQISKVERESVETMAERVGLKVVDGRVG